MASHKQIVSCCSVPHAHVSAQVAAAVSSQLGCLYTNSRYLSSELTSYCQELTDTLPEPLQVQYWVGYGRGSSSWIWQVL